MQDNWKDALSAIRGEFKEPDYDDSKSEETKKENSVAKQKEFLKIFIDKKGRNGKTATIIEGFTIDQEKVEEIARKLKQKIGVGGSVRQGEILIQGDHKKFIMEFLSSMDFKCKLC